VQAHGGRIALLLLLFVVALPEGGSAQGGQSFVTFQFSFANPGARSLGIGGAFVALADDATAAFANPAGLVQLIEPEVSLEIRHWSYSTPYTRGGRIDGEPTGNGIDTELGLRIGESNDDITALSFLSFVYPATRWSLALYRHELSNFEFSSQTDALFRESAPPDPPGLTSRSLDVRAAADTEIDTYGFAGAFRVSDKLSLGFGMNYYEARLCATVEGFTFDSFEEFWEANSYLPENLVSTVKWSMDETDVGLTGGFLWRISELWRVGGFYRQGPNLQLLGQSIAGPANPAGLPAGTVQERAQTSIDFPDVYGLGVAFRSSDGRLAVSFDWDRVEYASIIESVELDTEQTLDDGDELHLGSEYVFLAAMPAIAVRGGIWLDPDHRLRATDDDRVNRAFFPLGDDELHFAFGVGVVWRTLQVDLGVDLSDLVDTVSLSAIYGF
jgi:hypothetical protein